MNIAEASAHHVVMDASDDVGGFTGVAHVTFDVNQAFLGRVRKAQYLCSRHDFTQIRSEYEPTQWSDTEGLPRPVVDAELVVTSKAFWLHGTAPDGASVKSELIDIAAFTEERQALTAHLG